MSDQALIAIWLVAMATWIAGALTIALRLAARQEQHGRAVTLLVSEVSWLCAVLAITLIGIGHSGTRPWLAISLDLVAGAAAVWAPRSIRRPAPGAMLAVGLCSIGLVGTVLFVPALPGLWGARWALPVSWAFLITGVWLSRHAAIWEQGLGAAVRIRLTRASWGALLLPVAAMSFELMAFQPQFRGAFMALAWAASVALLASVVVVAVPDVAADLAVAGMLGLGFYGLALALLWPVHLPLPPTPMAGPAFLVRYGAVVVANRPTALLAGAQGLALLAFGIWLAPRTIGAQLRALLAGHPELTGRIERLTQTRADAVDTAAAELRRVERDLHDGTQARLVALGMSLRAAERLVTLSPHAAIELIVEAREASATALSELRDLVRGIYPPVLADRGLSDAIRALAMDTPLRTHVDIDLPGRPERPVEAACYFAVAEALANAVKHSGAALVQIRVGCSAGMLRLEVIDDGCGGADPARGTGLLGVERRLGTFDGILAVSSPPGGPTMIVMEVPCALSSPKISSC